MLHPRVLGVKFTYITTILLVTLTAFGQFSILNVLVTAALVTAFLTILGDLWFVPRLGPPLAAPAAVVIAGLTVWATELVLIGFGLPFTTLAASALLIGAAEHLFHLSATDALLGKPDNRWDK